MEEAFDCKETVFMKDYVRMDFLGMEISIDKEFMYLSMIAYIENSCDKLSLLISQTQNQSLLQSIALSKLIHHDSMPNKHNLL